MEANLYEDAHVYDVFFGAAVSQPELDFYSFFIRQFGEPALELACGTGRITTALARSGLDLHGLDLSPAMLEHARQKAQAAGKDIPFYCADMRDFAIGRRFGFIFIPCQSFQHLHTRKDVEGCLAAVRDHLLPGGAFLIQVFNPYPPLLASDPTRRIPTSREILLGRADGGTVLRRVSEPLRRREPNPPCHLFLSYGRRPD